MRQLIFVAAALSLLAVAMGDVAAQTARPMPVVQGLPPQSGQIPANIARVDPLRALQDQVAELKAQVAALKQANEALAAKVQTLDGGLGQVLTQNIGQTKQINDLSSQISSVSTKLANHQHSFKYKFFASRNDSFVKEVGGIGQNDKYGTASEITKIYDVDGVTGPAQ